MALDRRRRTEILIKGDEGLSQKLANEIISKYEIKEIESPNQGLAMIKMRETSKKELFYLGEVLVTEAKVFVEGTLGMGIVVGDKDELAFNLAIVDAAYNKGLADVNMWKDILLEEEVRIKDKEKKETAKILETKVDFSTMNI